MPLPLPHLQLGPPGDSRSRGLRESYVAGAGAPRLSPASSSSSSSLGLEAALVGRVGPATGQGLGQRPAGLGLARSPMPRPSLRAARPPAPAPGRAHSAALSTRGPFLALECPCSRGHPSWGGVLSDSLLVAADTVRRSLSSAFSRPPPRAPLGSPRPVSWPHRAPSHPPIPSPRHRDLSSSHRSCDDTGWGQQGPGVNAPAPEPLRGLEQEIPGPRWDAER